MQARDEMKISERSTVTVGVLIVLLGMAAAWGNINTRVDGVEKAQNVAQNEKLEDRKLLIEIRSSVSRIEGRLENR